MERAGNTEGEGFRGCPTPARPCLQVCLTKSLLQSWRVSLSGQTLDGGRRPGGCQALSFLLTFFSLHCCFVLKQAVTGCVLERTADPGLCRLLPQLARDAMWLCQPSGSTG